MKDEFFLKRRSINVRVSEQTIKIIDKAISIGYAKSYADFAEKAIISKLEELGFFSQK